MKLFKAHSDIFTACCGLAFLWFFSRSACTSVFR
jgi:hypothetical protein